MKKSVKFINRFESVIQTNYDIVKAHGGELTVETKEVRERNSSFNYCRTKILKQKKTKEYQYS